MPSSRPTLREHVERELQLVARVRGRDDGADARLVARDGRKRDALREDALLEQPVRQLHRQRALADDHRRDRALAQAGVEAERLQAGLEEPRVLPQPLDDLRLLLEHVERRDARGRDRRRMRGREQERPRAVIEELDQRAAAGDVAAERADRLRQRADLDVDAAVHAEVIDGAAAVPAEHAARMRVVDHHDAAEFLGERRTAPAARRGRRPC